jgi:iron complex outermembrane receptor protein
MDMQVTSVSKKEQKLSKAGAAIYVITQGDIRSSGATNVPDLLRMAPGVNVAQLNANVWAISIRGFNGLYGDKVLVLIDGRSVYSPSFSGVFWDAQDVPLEDIERIEVIRGPGGTVWGANAMNGVINIITKSAKNTKGGTIVAGTGSETRADGLIQYGGSIGSKGAYRVFGRYFDVGSFHLANGALAGDGERTIHGGFRTDWDLSSRDTMTIQGDLARLNGGQTYSTVFSDALPLEKTIHDRVEMSSGNVLARWNRAFRDGSAISLQVYDDYYHRVNSGLGDTKNTVDVDFQDHIAIWSRHDIVWGLGARVTTGHFDPGYSVSVVPRGRTDLLLSAFFQDEVRIGRSLWFTFGSKFEHNGYTGLEFEPGGKLVWMPANQHEIWVSADRAIRQPNVIDSGIQVDAAILPVAGAPFGLLKILGNPNDFDAEQLTDFEAGYRAQFNPRLSLDVAAFLSIYTHLQTSEPQAPYFTSNPGPPHLVFPLVFDDQSHARNYGGETFLNWSVTKRWRISPGYSMLRMVVKRYPDSRDSTIEQTPGQSPGRQFQIRSSLILPHRVEWDASLAHVGPLTSAGVPGYTRVDTRVGWRWGERLEFSIVGQNLLRPRHAEFFDSFGLNHSEIERSVFGKMVWRF